MSAMSNTAEGLSPLAAYEQLMHFAKRRGEFALRLAMHAAVPQGIQPELLHLLKRNFVPEAGDDPALEADILFSNLCEELGRGYFRFDPQVRALLLENLVANYSGETESRISKVADFLIAYVDHYDRSTSGSQDQLWRDYLEMQRWVAFAFVDPPGAAQQLAAALESANSSGDFVARIQLGGLASALAAPLAGFPGLLNYAAGLQALELGDRQRAGELFESLHEDELKIGNTRLRPTSQILAEWQARHPEPVPPAPEPEKSRELERIHRAIQALKSKDKRIRRMTAQTLGTIYRSEAAVPALIEALGDREIEVRSAAVDALAAIRTPNAVSGLVEALGNASVRVSRAALSSLKEMQQKLVLLTGSYTLGRDVFDAVNSTIIAHGYLLAYMGLVQISTRKFLERAFDFVIVDVTSSRRLVSPVERMLQLSIPVIPISHGGSRVPSMFADMEQRYPSLMKAVVYDTVSTLGVMLDRRISSLESEKSAKAPEHKKYAYDIFISYAQTDKLSTRLSNDLYRDLTLRLNALTGKQPKIFRYTKLTRGFFDETIMGAISKSALFVVILSPAYLASELCKREFQRIAEVAPWGPNERSRIFQVMLGSVSLQQQPDVLRGLVGYEFLGLDNPRQYVETMERLAHDIQQTLSLDTLTAEDKPQLDRWPVRIGTDRDVHKVSSNIVTTSVEVLITIEPPADLHLGGRSALKYEYQRSEPVETTIWSVDALLVAFKKTQNNTYRLILRGQSGATIIAQVVDPDLIQTSSRWIDTFRRVREKLNELNLIKAYTYVEPPMPARVVGVGHFGRAQVRGTARNGIQLEPILGVHWWADNAPTRSRKKSVKKRSSKKRTAKKPKAR